jgi:repressor LexA
MRIKAHGQSMPVPLEANPMALTKRQKEVLDYLVAFETKHGYAPSFEEIGKGLKLTSLATVHKHITTLEKKGFIRRGYNQSRSIEILQLPKSVKDQVAERFCARRECVCVAG